MKNKKLKILAIAIIVVIALLICIIISKKEIKRDITISKIDFMENISDEKVYVLNMFLDQFYLNNFTENSSYVQKTQDQVLDTIKNYISEKQDPKDYIKDESYSYLPLSIISKNENNIDYYIVEGLEFKASTINSDEIEMEKIYYNIAKDINTNAFVINNKSQDIDNLKQTYGYDSIKQNSNNKINVSLSDEKIVNLIYQNYKLLLRLSPQIAWDRLNEEYKLKRFENIDNFKGYIELISSKLNGMTLEKYKRDDYNYIVQDVYDNIYKFKVNKNYLDYEVFLDEYTLKNEEYNNNLDNMTQSQKLQVFVGDIISMINQKDYIQMYNLYLNDRYKANFEDLEDFKKFFKNSLYSFYRIETDQDIQVEKIGDIYKYTINLKDLKYDSYTYIILLIEPNDQGFTFAFGS